jgi:uncharacterized protein with PIN domain
MNDSDNLAETLQPVLKLATDTNLLTNAILRHYIETISSLTGKEKAEIQKELEKHFQDYKAEILAQQNSTE